MKKLLCIIISVVMCMGIMLSGCTGTYDKAPDEYKNIRWITPDYSFSIIPSKDCTGKYTFNNTTYDIKAEFSSLNEVTIYDQGKKDSVLFSGLWKYEDKNLYIYDIIYNTDDYKEFKNCYNEYVTLDREKLDK